MKPLLVGQAPARSGDGRPFTGASGKRLCQLLDVPDYDALAHVLDMTNLIPDVQPKIQGKKGDSFDKALAKRSAIRIYNRALSDGREVLILAGMGVGRCFLPDKKLQYFHTYWGVASMRIFVIPHPSGINHYWNNPSNVDAASKLLRAIVFGWSMNHPSLRNLNAQR